MTGDGELREWMASHKVLSEERWREQRERNDKTGRDMEAIELRLSSLEKKIIWFTGLAAGAGSALGRLLGGG